MTKRTISVQEKFLEQCLVKPLIDLDLELILTSLQFLEKLEGEVNNDCPRQIRIHLERRINENRLNRGHLMISISFLFREEWRDFAKKRLVLIKKTKKGYDTSKLLL